MILIILLSFIVTGAVSYVHYKNENSQYHKERLERKEKSVIHAMDYYLRNQGELGQSDSIVQLFDEKICELADINNMDINIYSLEGELLISSQPELQEAGVIPERIPYSVVHEISPPENRILVQKKTDSITFLSTYSMLYNQNDEAIALINLPYFDANDFHREELEKFLVSLTEIYIILFLTAVLLAYFLTSYITKSLLAISEKIKSTRLAQENPPLEWPYDDEIGSLVNEYNRMVEVLEASAKKLAQQEREEAWSEMARQVAHEIKNPLTPMRLNVQHFSQSIKTDEPQKLKEFTESMLEQIDILSNIASAFSRFASLPQINLRPIDLNLLIAKVTRNYPGSNIHFKSYQKPILVNADEEHLMRALGNLVNNALQAIPPERNEEIKIVLQQTGERASIEIHDNGIGIAEDTLERVFEPRFTTKSSGMGLGLAIVKGTISSLGGTISCSSRQGEGSVFTILLPAVISENENKGVA